MISPDPVTLYVPYGARSSTRCRMARPQLVGERQASALILDHRWVDAPGGEREHGAHEVVAVADHPRRSDDVVPRHRGHHLITRGLCLAVDAERRDRILFAVGPLCGTVEHVVAGDVDERDAVRRGDPRQRGHTGDVGRPRRRRVRSASRLGRIHGGEGRGVDDRLVIPPAKGVFEVRRRQVDVGAVNEFDGRPVGVGATQGPAQLPSGTENQGLSGRHRRDVGQPRVRPVLGRQLRALQRDRPIDAHCFVGQVQERVRGVGGVVVVHQVRVRGIGLQRLERVADTAGHEHCPRWVEFRGEHCAEGGTVTQIDPRAEDAPRRDRDVTCPTARRGMPLVLPAASLNEMLFWTGPKSGSPAATIFSPLPVLLEPPAVVAVDGQLPHRQAGNRSLVGAQRFTVFGHVSLPELGVERLGGALGGGPPLLMVRGTSRWWRPSPAGSLHSGVASRVRRGAWWSRSHSGDRDRPESVTWS